MTDIVFIRQFKVQTVIGVFEWEKAIQQTLVFDLELATDIRKAAATDDLQYTPDYSAVCAAIEELCRQPHELIETVAEKVAAMVLDNFQITAVKVTIGKPDAVPAAASVGVSICRGHW
jgi:7,8-dihydroneopterin aldolase/epimerase/oxygenase